MFVALIGSLLGTVSLLAPIGEMDDFLGVAVLCGTLSVGLWLLLAPVIQGKSVWVAALVGLISPLLVCLAIPFLGLVWLTIFSKGWYYTLLVGIGTGISMHSAINADRDTLA